MYNTHTHAFIHELALAYYNVASSESGNYLQQKTIGSLKRKRTLHNYRHKLPESTVLNRMTRKRCIIIDGVGERKKRQSTCFHQRAQRARCRDRHSYNPLKNLHKNVEQP